jgi:hypothetical protein
VTTIEDGQKSLQVAQAKLERDLKELATVGVKHNGAGDSTMCGSEEWQPRYVTIAKLCPLDRVRQSGLTLQECKDHWSMVADSALDPDWNVDGTEVRIEVGFPRNAQYRVWLDSPKAVMLQLRADPDAWSTGAECWLEMTPQKAHRSLVFRNLKRIVYAEFTEVECSPFPQYTLSASINGEWGQVVSMSAYSAKVSWAARALACLGWSETEAEDNLRALCQQS